MEADNAIIMAAGASSRFCPISRERHKALTVVRGEVLIERQIRQLREAGVDDIYLVTGYKAEQFDYLRDTFGVRIVHNDEWLTRNNTSSIWASRHILANSYVCSSDNYFTVNPFMQEPDGAYYAAEWAEGNTAEWCMERDADGRITAVTVGGAHAWYMLGHAFWDAAFSMQFLKILAAEYDLPETADKLWETVFMEHLDELAMRVREYAPGIINEFDTLDELRDFDSSYRDTTGSSIMAEVAALVGCTEGDIAGSVPLKGATAEAKGFEFRALGHRWTYLYDERRLDRID